MTRINIVPAQFVWHHIMRWFVKNGATMSAMFGRRLVPSFWLLEPYTTHEPNGTRAMKHTDFKVHNTYYYWLWGGPWLVWLLYLWWESQEVTISNTRYIVARDRYTKRVTIHILQSSTTTQWKTSVQVWSCMCV